MQFRECCYAFRPKEFSIGPPAQTYFKWPKGTRHLLGVLQSGFVTRPELLTANIRETAGAIVFSAYGRGTVVDRKWSLDLAGITPGQILLRLLRHAFASPSSWLRTRHISKWPVFLRYRLTFRVESKPLLQFGKKPGFYNERVATQHICLG